MQRRSPTGSPSGSRRHREGADRAGSGARRQILLDEPRAEVDVELDEGTLADAAEAVDLAGLDDENVAGARFELFAVDGPESAAPMIAVK